MRDWKATTHVLVGMQMAQSMTQTEAEFQRSHVHQVKARGWVGERAVVAHTALVLNVHADVSRAALAENSHGADAKAVHLTQTA